MALKIAYCTPSLYLAGGVERVLTTKVNYLADVLGHDVTVVLTDGAGKEPFYPLSPRVKVVQLDIGFERMWNRPLWHRAWIYIWGMRQFRRALRQCLLQMKADIVVSTMRREINFLNSIPDGSRKIGELHVTRSHYRNFEANENNRLKQWLSKIWTRQLVAKVKRLDALVVLTPHELTQWPELTNVHCIPNPLPFRLATDAELSQRSSHSDGGAVMCVGRYSYQKGIDLLIEAWSRIAPKHAGWRLDIYGSGDREPYRSQAVSLGLLPDDGSYDGTSLRLQPAAADIRSQYLCHDIYALSSRFEGFGMVIIEAQACALPVVAMDCPTGPRELVADGENGLLVPDGDVDSFAGALDRLITDDALRRQMSSAAHSAVSRFDVKNVMQQWQQLFDAI